MNFVPSLLSRKQQQHNLYKLSMLTTFLQETFALFCALKFSQYFQPRIGRKVRIFSLGGKKTTFLYKKRVQCAVCSSFDVRVSFLPRGLTQLSNDCLETQYISSKRACCFCFAAVVPSLAKFSRLLQRRCLFLLHLVMSVLSSL